MRCHLANYTEKNLFTGRPLPAMTDARFWPNSQTLLNIMRRASAANQWVAEQLQFSPPLFLPEVWNVYDATLAGTK